MKTWSFASMLRVCAVFFFVITVLPVSAAPDLVSAFAADGEGWRASDVAATLSWQNSGGTPDGYLRGSRSGSTAAWHFVSPHSWTGNWSSYKVLKFDISIPTRHYPDADRAGMVVIVGTNGAQLAWTASTPLWTWTHYEVSLTPAVFGVDQATFDSVMTNVAEMRILAEFAAATESVGLDNVLVTETPPEAYQVDLASRFSDGTIQGWRPVDDVTLSATEIGQPGLGLFANDWMDGRLYKIATPVTWAGDWRQFRRLSFDMQWAGAAAAHDNVELVRIFGANGNTLSWSNSLIGGVWTNRSIPLLPETFGVSAAELQGVLEHVSEMWIFGEFGGSDDLTYLDNVVLTANTNGPPRLTQNFVSRFDASDEGWVVFDNGTLTWQAVGGISGGGLRCIDAGSGTARFQTPDAWSGDWRNFQTLRFMIKSDAAGLSANPMIVWIATWDGRVLRLDLPHVPGSWTPFTVDLTPATFGVSSNEFDAIMGDVACAWIRAEIGTGTDTSFLDNVALLTETGAGLPPDRWSDFESGTQDWRKGGWNDSSGVWTFGGAPTHNASDGNPAGHVENTDEYDWTFWFSPAAWAGDWRGIQSISLDFKVINGTAANLFGTWMISIISAYTNLNADVAVLPVPGQWGHYEFPITPAAFGVSEAEFNQVMRDVVALGIRSEWISGGEREGLDNVRVTKASDAYWAWMSGYFTAGELADETITGRLADADKDGADNWCEFIAGTVPTNRLDLLRIERVCATNATCLLDFDSKPGRLYGVERADALSPTNAWSAVTNDIPGNGFPMTVPVAIGSTQQFYRLKARRDQ